MAEHLALETIDRYRAGTLPPDRLLAVDDHLAACHECRTLANERLDLAASASTLLRTLGRAARGEHCSYESLEAYVDGRLPADERQQVVVHIEDCAMCAEDLGDLRNARALLQTDLPPRPAGFWSALQELWRQRWMTITGGAVVAALGVWLVLAVGTREIQPVQQQAREAPVERPGDTAPTAPGPAASTAVAVLRDGKGEVALLANGELSGFTSLSETARQAVAAALSTGRLTVVATTTLTMGPGTLRGTESPGAFVVTEPVGRVVEVDRPTFRWTAHPAARAYRVAVFDTSFSEIASSAEISASEWAPDSPLPRGRTFLWQVTALTPDGPVQAPAPPAAEARFMVLDRAQADELAHVRRTEPESHLALAVLYARAGMREEAEGELQLLARRNPDSTLVQNLLASLRQ